MAEVTGQSADTSTPDVDVAAATDPLAQISRRKPRTLWRDAATRFRRHRLAMIGAFILIFMIIAVVIGPFLRPQTEIDFQHELLGPSLDRPMGTDDLGRDVFARLLYGGRISIAVGLVAMIISVTVGTMVGSMAGFFGGFIDSALMRLTDMMLSLPSLPLLLLISYLFRESMKQKFGTNIGMFMLIVGVIGLLAWMPVARLVRASFLSIKQKEFVEAAHCIGASRTSLIFKHILPNTLSPVIVAATLGVGSAIITESSLSFLGLGFPPDIPTWGQLLFSYKDWLPIAWWTVIFPGMAIFIAVLSINYVGDGLRDALDPRFHDG